MDCSALTDELEFVEVFAGLCDDQRGRLREIAVEEFVGLVPCVAVREHCRADPRDGDTAEYECQHTVAQRWRTGTFNHGGP